MQHASNRLEPGRLNFKSTDTETASNAPKSVSSSEWLGTWIAWCLHAAAAMSQTDPARRKMCTCELTPSRHTFRMRFPLPLGVIPHASKPALPSTWSVSSSNAASANSQFEKECGSEAEATFVLNMCAVAAASIVFSTSIDKRSAMFLEVFFLFFFCLPCSNIL